MHGCQKERALKSKNYMPTRCRHRKLRPFKKQLIERTAGPPHTVSKTKPVFILHATERVMIARYLNSEVAYCYFRIIQECFTQDLSYATYSGAVTICHTRKKWCASSLLFCITMDQVIPE